jgi:hypothetical protein
MSLQSEIMNEGFLSMYLTNKEQKTSLTFEEQLLSYKADFILYFAQQQWFQDLTKNSLFANTVLFLISPTGGYIEAGLASLLVLYMFSGSSKPVVKLN